MQNKAMGLSGLPHSAMAPAYPPYGSQVTALGLLPQNNLFSYLLV